AVLIIPPRFSGHGLSSSRRESELRFVLDWAETMIAERPPDDHARPEAEHHSEVEPALSCASCPKLPSGSTGCPPNRGKFNEGQSWLAGVIARRRNDANNAHTSAALRLCGSA